MEEGETPQPKVGHVFEGEESEEEEEGEATEGGEASVTTPPASVGLVLEGEDDEEDEESTDPSADAPEQEQQEERENVTRPSVAKEGAKYEAGTNVHATADAPDASADTRTGDSAYGSLGAFSESIVPLLRPRRKTLVQEQSATERKLIRHNQAIRTIIGAKLHHTFQSTHKEVAQVSHQLDLVRNITQDLNIKVRCINDDLEKLTAMVDKTGGAFLQLLQPSLQGRTLHT